MGGSSAGHPVPESRSYRADGDIGVALEANGEQNESIRGGNRMRVEQLMTRTVQTCTPSDCLERAAGIMWDHDCGALPVTSADGEEPRVVGMLTDRDVCMAAYTQGRALRDI